MDENKAPLASEMYEDLKQHAAFLQKMIVGLLIVIGVLIAALSATNIYHIDQWSKFETVVVDSGEGEGNANYVQGDNTGGIYNGEGSSTSPEVGNLERNQNPSS